MMLKGASAILATLFILFHGTVASAESLNAHDIRALYARMDAAIRDGEATRKIDDAVMDDGYVRNSETTFSFADQPPVTNQVFAGKPQILLGAVNIINQLKISRYDHPISDIKFTNDKNWAYVYSKTVSMGTAGSRESQIRYSNTTSCVDTLALRQGILKLMRSDCKENIKMNKS